MIGYFTWDDKEPRHFFRVNEQTGDIDPKPETDVRYLHRLAQATSGVGSLTGEFYGPASGLKEKAIIAIVVDDRIPPTLASLGFKLI